ncbi:MAG TPA: amidohydrolase family protein [Candidatus Dormibacteraeota bacterium]|nr:amidohydrolase family protein [Candidatus Dormibacteraeota bacterium]
MPTTAVFGDALLEPSTGEVVRDAVVLIENDRVIASSARSKFQVPADAQRVDAEGLWLLPGLIDCHVHLCVTGATFDLGERLGRPPSLTVLQSVDACAKDLAAGFTSVRDAGGTPNGVRMAVERGYFPGPRMKLAIQILSETGGHADGMFPCGVPVPIANTPDIPPSVVDGVEPMRHRVRELVRAGADWIKLCTSGGVLSPGDAPHHPAFTVEEIRAAVEEAAAHGRQVMAHAQANAGIKNALRAGVRTIEHGIWLDDDAIEMMLDGGHVLVPTLVAPEWVVRHANEGRMPQWAADKGRAVVADHKASVRKAIEAGVKIAFGTDTGVGPHGTMGEEFLMLNALGMEPIKCLRSATSVAAEVIGLEGAGSLAAGSFGDVIGVPGNPLEDLNLIAKPENVRLVVKGGAVVKRLAA